MQLAPTEDQSKISRWCYLLATLLLLFPTAHKSMCNCHSPRLGPVEITGLHCSLLADLALCSLLFPTAHKSMCNCHSPRLVLVDVAGLHCNLLADLACAPGALPAAVSDSAQIHVQLPQPATWPSRNHRSLLPSAG